MLKQLPLRVKLKNAHSLAGLDKAGVDAASVGHKWTPEERALYEKRVREFTRKRKS